MKKLSITQAEALTILARLSDDPCICERLKRFIAECEEEIAEPPPQPARRKRKSSRQRPAAIGFTIAEDEEDFD